jgi:hypothetical protein
MHDRITNLNITLEGNRKLLKKLVHIVRRHCTRLEEDAADFADFGESLAYYRLNCRLVSAIDDNFPEPDSNNDNYAEAYQAIRASMDEAKPITTIHVSKIKSGNRNI